MWTYVVKVSKMDCTTSLHLHVTSCLHVTAQFHVDHHKLQGKLVQKWEHFLWGSAIAVLVRATVKASNNSHTRDHCNSRPPQEILSFLNQLPWRADPPRKLKVRPCSLWWSTWNYAVTWRHDVTCRCREVMQSIFDT